MSCIVIRSKKSEGKLDAKNPLHRLQMSIPWPEGAVSAYRKHHTAEWEFTTKKDILKEKKKNYEQRLWIKREYGVARRVPLYVWVFWCPGFNGIFYRGWWVYLIGKGIETGKYFEGSNLMIRVMELFPLVEPTLFGPPDTGKWKTEFVKRYPRGIRSGKPQGKSAIWAEVKEQGIERIISRARWPKRLVGIGCE